MRATYTDLNHKPVTRQEFIDHLHAFADGSATNEQEKAHFDRFIDTVLVPNMDDDIRAQGLQS